MNMSKRTRQAQVKKDEAEKRQRQDVSPSPCTQEPATAAAAEAIYMQSVPRRSGAMQPHAETPEAPRHQAQTDLGPEPAAAPLRPCFRDQIWNANHSSSPSTSGTPISMPHERGRTTSTAWASADTSPPPQLRRAGQGTSEPLTIKVLSFNIWMTDLLVAWRMAGLAELMEREQPDIALFQEVTPTMQKVWRQQEATWLNDYELVLPDKCEGMFTMAAVRRSTVALDHHTRKRFSHTYMGRDVLILDVRVHGGRAGGCAVPLTVATTHLESPWFSLEKTLGFKAAAVRQGQMAEALNTLEDHSPLDTLLVGDLNWIPGQQAAEPEAARPSWRDVWKVLKPLAPGQQDARWFNPMTANSRNRIDRALLLPGHEPRWRAVDICMAGIEPLAGRRCRWGQASGAPQERPVCISDHYGLMTTLRVCEPGTAGDDAPAARVTHEDHGRRPDTP